MKNWEKSTNTRVAGLLSLVAAVNLLDKDEAEKQLKEGVEAFLKGNKAMIENLLSSYTNSTLNCTINKKGEVDHSKCDLSELSEKDFSYNKALSDVLSLIDMMVGEGKA